MIATYNGREPKEPITVPDNAVLVPWLSYSKTMPLCDVVVLHAGHGTLVRALAAGCSVVACPAGGDMNENAARVDWAGVGVRIAPRWLGARTLQLAVRRALRPEIRARVAEVAAWAAQNDGAVRAAEELEAWAARADVNCGWVGKRGSAARRPRMISSRTHTDGRSRNSSPRPPEPTLPSRR